MKIGAAAWITAVSPESRRVSAKPSSQKGTALLRDGEDCDRHEVTAERGQAAPPREEREQEQRPEEQPPEGDHGRLERVHPELDEQEGRAPDRGEQQQEEGVPARHVSSTLERGTRGERVRTLCPLPRHEPPPGTTIIRSCKRKKAPASPTRSTRRWRPVNWGPSLSLGLDDRGGGTAGLAQDGPNALERPHGPAYGRIAARQLVEPLVGLLVAAALVSAAIGETVEAGGHRPHRRPQRRLRLHAGARGGARRDRPARVDREPRLR